MNSGENIVGNTGNLNPKKFANLNTSGTFVIGALSGFAAGMILAPEKGTVTRTNIQNWVNTLGSRFNENVTPAFNGLTQNLTNLFNNWTKGETTDSIIERPKKRKGRPARIHDDSLGAL